MHSIDRVNRSHIESNFPTKLPCHVRARVIMKMIAGQSSRDQALIFDQSVIIPLTHWMYWVESEIISISAKQFYLSTKKETRIVYPNLWDTLVITTCDYLLPYIIYCIITHCQSVLMWKEFLTNSRTWLSLENFFPPSKEGFNQMRPNSDFMVLGAWIWSILRNIYISKNVKS